MKDKLIGLVMLATFIGAVLWVCSSFKYGSAYLGASVFTTFVLCVVAGMCKREIRQ